ncbi:MAG: hypothetical protein KUG73_15670, partial [Pseudomonadales bacterium]|nr:hypothetical protein [Pseudomonadales bacterium]
DSKNKTNSMFNWFDGNEDDGFLLKVLALDLGVEDATLNTERLQSGTVIERLDYILGLAKSAQLLPSSMKSKDFERRFEIFQANFRALSTYKGEKCDVSLSLIKAETALDQHKGAPGDMGWSDLVSSVNSVESLPGDHFSLIKKPTVTTLASILDAQLLKASTE